MNDTELHNLLETTTTIAVVGCSTHPDKAAHRIPLQLKAAGFHIIPVHPTAKEVIGERAYPRLANIPEPIDLVDIFRPAPECAGIVRQAVATGATAVWLQLGIYSEEARQVAEAAGITYIEDRCLGVDVARLGITKH